MDHPATVSRGPQSNDPGETPQSRFAERRARVREQLGARAGARAVLVLAASPEVHVGPDAELRYVVDSELYYLTGYTEPEAVLVLSSAVDGYTLFVRPRDRERELWTGVRGGLEAATVEFGADRSYPIDALGVELPRLLADAELVAFRQGGGRSDVDAIISSTIARARRGRPRTGRGVTTLTDPGVILDDMRARKDDDEIARIRHAADISVMAFREAAALVAAGTGEWRIEAALQSGFRSRRAAGEAFASIVGGASNATVLHYTTNNDVLENGSFVLIDAGARANMYCADITRTYAVGTVSGERQALHDIVRSAHDAAVRVCAADSTIEDVDMAARSELVRGMIDLGLIDGPVDVALKKDDYKRYYPHRTCHWLGLDVHDVGSYVTPDGAPMALAAGMVFTVEPGIYIPRADERARPSLRGTGVRLEDDVLITANGADVITSALPLDADPAASCAKYTDD